MNNANPGQSYHVEKLDADAVCAQCSTVNAEGTLLCKTCGNNLRDQRNRRLMADQAMDLEHTGRRRRAWVSGILFVLALGLILSTLLNQELIVDWLVEVQSSAEPTAEILWNADYEAVFQPMFVALESAAITGESALAALETAPASTEIDGLYALFSEDEAFIGSARVLTEGEYVYFAAMLLDGEEVRGVGQAQANHFISLPDSAGMMRRGRLTTIKGVAMPQGNGVVECMGDDNQTRASFLAYRLPDA